MCLRIRQDELDARVADNRKNCIEGSQSSVPELGSVWRKLRKTLEECPLQVEICFILDTIEIVDTGSVHYERLN